MNKTKKLNGKEKQKEVKRKEKPEKAKDLEAKEIAEIAAGLRLELSSSSSSMSPVIQGVGKKMVKAEEVEYWLRMKSKKMEETLRSLSEEEVQEHPGLLGKRKASLEAQTLMARVEHFLFNKMVTTEYVENEGYYAHEEEKECAELVKEAVDELGARAERCTEMEKKLDEALREMDKLKRGLEKLEEEYVQREINRMEVDPLEPMPLQAPPPIQPLSMTPLEPMHLQAPPSIQGLNETEEQRETKTMDVIKDASDKPEMADDGLTRGDDSIELGDILPEMIEEVQEEVTIPTIKGGLPSIGLDELLGAEVIVSTEVDADKHDSLSVASMET